MDPERWPAFIRMFVDELGSRNSGVVVSADYNEPLWRIEARCPCCKTTVMWHLMAEAPLPAAETVPLPAWVARLNDLPPRG
jgi:hypothetical protein